jgi:putative oxidoreductase
MHEPAYSMLLLTGRILLSAVYLYSGIDKAWRFAEALDEFRAARLQNPHLWVILTVVLHLSASAALIVGRFVTESALALAIFTIFATFLAHDFWRRPPDEAMEVSRVAAANLAVIGGLLVLAAVGPGKYVL